MISLEASIGTLVAGGSSVETGWVNLQAARSVVVGKISAGGAYVFEIDWSRDGATVDWVQPVTVPDKGSVVVDVVAPWARFRVKNTDLVAPFTAHRTNIVRRT